MAGTQGPVYDIISAGDYIYVAGEFKAADGTQMHIVSMFK